MRGPRPYATRPKPEFRAFSSSPPNAVSKARQMLCFSPARAKSLLRTPSFGLAIFVLLPASGGEANATWLGLALCISFLADIYDNFATPELAQQIWASLLAIVSSLSSQFTPYVLVLGSLHWPPAGHCSA